MRHFSDVILKGTLIDVERALSRPVPLNEQDPYGYTPLIEAAIINDLEKAKLLVAYGADVNGQDLTGGTALHWATENNNLELASFLLEKGANPNLYTTASEPPLVKPLLRRQQAMRDILVEHGASILFAQDFIHTKLLGHRFELVGQVDIVDPDGKFTELDLEGFFLEFSVDLITDSLHQFRYNYAAREVRHYLAVIDEVVNALSLASELVQYQHYQLDAKQYRQRIEPMLHQQPLIIPLAIQGHALSLVRYKSLLVKCDRRSEHDFADTLTVYRINNLANFNYQLLHNLMYERHTNAVIEGQLERILALEPVSHFVIRRQISGNCSWANIEAAVPACLYLLTHPNQGDLPAIITPDNEALRLYQRWLHWDKARALTYCLDSFYQATPARKAAKAALLAALLFQRCGASDAESVERAKVIIKALHTPGYEYVLESYKKVYVDQVNNPAGQNLLKLLEKYDEF